jgi:type I restriction enzyme R subunit
MTSETGEPSEPEETVPEGEQPPGIIEPPDPTHRKLYFDGGHVDIATHMVYELDSEGKQLRMVRFTDYTAEKVRTLFTNAADLRKAWADPARRSEIIDSFTERGIDFDELARAAKQPDADPFDLLCHVAFNAPLRTRRERADRLLKDKKVFFDQYGPEARAILNELLEKYAEHGTAQFAIPEVLEVPPINQHGNVREIAQQFGGEDGLVEAIQQLQALLYAA